MAQKTVRTCDRCGKDTHGRFRTIAIHGPKARTMDLCGPCWEPLERWLSRNNATIQGDTNRPKDLRGPGWVEVCPHHIPCAGPCPTPQWRQA